MGYNGKHPAQLDTELDALLVGIAGKEQLAALCVDVEIAGARVSKSYRDGGRPVAGDDRPVFAIGCIIDVLIAVMCLDLRDRHGLDLDAPFDSVLPELRPLASANPQRPITIGHLLTRTSGLQDPRTIDEMRVSLPWRALAGRVKATRLLFSPGTVFNYGGIDRVILIELVERFTGTSLHRIGQRVITEPCGITNREVQYGPTEADGFRPIEKFDTTTLLTIIAQLARRDIGKADHAFSKDVRYYLQLERIRLSRSMDAQPWPHAAVAFTFGLFKHSDGLIGFNGWDDNQSCAVRYDPMSEVSFTVGLQGPPAIRDVIVSHVAQLLGYWSVQSRAVPCTVGGLNGLRPEQITGGYVGWADGYEANVRLEGADVCCDLIYRRHRFRQVRARLEEGAWLVTESLAKASALEFFRDERTGRVCLASGFLPYAMADPRA
jgi:hypothetical protein